MDSFVKNRFIIWLCRLQYVADVTDFVTNYNCGIRNQFKIWTFSEFKNLSVTGWLLSLITHFRIERWCTNALLCNTCVTHSDVHRHCKMYLSTDPCGVSRNTIYGTLNDWSLIFNTTAVLNPKKCVYWSCPAIIDFKTTCLAKCSRIIILWFLLKCTTYYILIYFDWMQFWSLNLHR